MGLKEMIISAILSLLLINVSSAEWAGPQEKIIGTWGSDDDQFGLEQGDTFDVVPKFILISQGKIIVKDGANKRVKVYSNEGIIEKIVSYRTGRHYSELTLSDEYGFSGDFIGFTGDGGVVCFRPDQNKFIKFSLTGTILQTYTTRPQELGVWSFKCKQGIPTLESCKSLHFEIEYPNAVYVYDQTKTEFKSDLQNQVRINNDLIMDNQREFVYAYGVTSVIPKTETKKERRLLGWKAIWESPKGKFTFHPNPDDKTIGGTEEVIEEYGDAIIGPDGSIYTWMRTPSNYKIIKWKWQEGS